MDAICTIIKKNYLPAALALQESAPDIQFRILLMEDEESPFDSPHHFTDFKKYVNRTAVEQCTAIRAEYFSYLLKSHERLLYLDPDTLLFKPPTEAFERLNHCNVLVTPHFLSPAEPKEEIRVLLTGTYNMGFMGLRASEETTRLLAWWGERLNKYCYRGERDGVFYDQKWLELMPALFEGVEVFKHPGYNVAYWNLHERDVQIKDGQWHCQDRPLVLFHFSGMTDKGLTKYSSIQMPELEMIYRRLLEKHGTKPTTKENVRRIGLRHIARTIQA